MAEDAKNEYSRCLVEFNKQQHDHHIRLIPDLLNTSQRLALENGNCFREVVKNYCVAERSFRPLIGKNTLNFFFEIFKQNVLTTLIRRPSM